MVTIQDTRLEFRWEFHKSEPTKLYGKAESHGRQILVMIEGLKPQRWEGRVFVDGFEVRERYSRREGGGERPPKIGRSIEDIVWALERKAREHLSAEMERAKAKQIVTAAVSEFLQKERRKRNARPPKSQRYGSVW